MRKAGSKTLPPDIASMPFGLVSVKDAAAFAGMSESGVWWSVSEGRFPRPIKLGGRSLWDVRALREWSVRKAA